LPFAVVDGKIPMSVELQRWECEIVEIGSSWLFDSRLTATQRADIVLIFAGFKPIS